MNTTKNATLTALEHEAINVLAAASYDVQRIPFDRLADVLVFADAAILANHPLAGLLSGEWMTELLARQPGAVL